MAHLFCLAGASPAEREFSMLITSFSNRLFTSWLCFALSSTNLAFMCLANCCPSSYVTARSSLRSVLLPTKTMGRLERRKWWGYICWMRCQKYTYLPLPTMSRSLSCKARTTSKLFWLSMLRRNINQYWAGQGWRERIPVDQTEGIDVHCILGRKNRILILSSSIDDL